MYYLNLFFINSFFGFLLESILKIFVFHGMNNGILFGPWIPVYGFGSVIVVFLYKFIFGQVKCSNLWKTVILFFCVFILLTLLEWLGGTLIEGIFHKEFWSYRKQKYNIGPYISLGMSLLWSFVSIFFVYVVLPFENKIIKKIPRLLSISLVILILVDCFITYLLFSYKFLQCLLLFFYHS